MERILLISTMYPSKAHPTFGIFIKNQVEALEKRGHQVDLSVIRDPRMGKLFVLRKYILWMMKLIFILLKRGRTYTVIHAHYVFPSGWMGLLFKKIYGTRFIVTAHGGDLDKMAKKGPFFFNQTKKILHQADHLIAVGEKLKHDMVSTFTVGKDKITILNMGVNRTIFKPMNTSEARKYIGLSLSSIVILYVGNLIKAKGLEELVEAFRELKTEHTNAELHLIGASKEPLFLNKLQARITAENIQDVTIHQPKNQKHIAVWLAAADIFVLPSHMEGFGLVALEAMSCHTPVVGSDVGGLSYLLKNAGIKVEPKNTESLHRGIESIIKNDDLRRELIAQGEEKAQQYDEKLLTGKLIKIYQE